MPRFRLRPHQDTTRTGRVYGPAHCIWSQKCHTDAPHALPPRSRTPPAIEISGGWLWKGKGLEKGFGFLFRVCASDNKLPRLFEIGKMRSEFVRVWIFNRLEFWEKILGEKKKPAPRGRGHSILTFLSYYPTGPRRSKPLSNFFPNAPPCPIQRERSVFRPQTLSTRNKATRSLDIVEHRHRYANNFDRENR